jgi:CheY-like chemotaxis protein
VADTQSVPRTQTLSNSFPLVSKRETILLVEDEALVREMTTEILEAEGYRVLQAKNASEALEIFRRFSTIVDLLLTDVVLPPGQNGRDLADELRKISPGLLTIFSSGYPVNAVTRREVRDEFTWYLPKPFSSQALLQKVGEVLLHAAEVAGDVFSVGYAIGRIFVD